MKNIIVILAATFFICTYPVRSHAYESHLSYWFGQFEKILYLPSAEYCYRLGVNYLTGKGVQKNDRLALIFFTQSASGGFAPAQFVLGRFYALGVIVPQDYNKAIEWFNYSAGQGNAEAQFYLGNLYQNGEGIEQNYDKAFVIFIRLLCKGI